MPLASIYQGAHSFSEKKKKKTFIRLCKTVFCLKIILFLHTEIHKITQFSSLLMFKLS